MSQLSKFSILRNIVFGIAAVVCAPSSWADCINPVVTPSTIVLSPKTGDPQIITAVTITLDCQPGDGYRFNTNAATFTGNIGSSSASKVAASFHRNASATLALWGSNIMGSYSGAAPGKATFTVWTKLTSEGQTIFDGQGSYSVTLLGQLGSGMQNHPISITHSGTIEGFCSIADSSIEFGDVTSGTNPIYPAQTLINCSKDMIYLISQPTQAPIMFGPEHRGYAWVFNDISATHALVDTPVQKTGLGRSVGELFEFYVRLDGMTRGTPLYGSGAFSSTIPILITY